MCHTKQVVELRNAIEPLRDPITGASPPTPLNSVYFPEGKGGSVSTIAKRVVIKDDANLSEQG